MVDIVGVWNFSHAKDFTELMCQPGVGRCSAKDVNINNHWCYLLERKLSDAHFVGIGVRVN